MPIGGAKHAGVVPSELHCTVPCWSTRNLRMLLCRPSRLRVAAASDFVEAMSQFWLCQNPSPAASAILTGITFQPTSAAVLKCLEVLVMHVNEHEKHRVETRAAEAHSCHILLRTAMYHFLKSQLEGLPDISARVAILIRENCPIPIFMLDLRCSKLRDRCLHVIFLRIHRAPCALPATLGRAGRTKNRCWQCGARRNQHTCD